ncbi:MAG: RNA polymerase sigma factor, partial [Planctomycetota bacterium]
MFALVVVFVVLAADIEWRVGKDEVGNPKEAIMRRIGGDRNKDVRLWVYDGIIRCYLRYVVIRCAKLTNSKEEAGRIAYCALVTTCLLAEQLEDAGQVGRVVDMMVDVGGKEMLGERREVEGAERNGGELLTDERMQTVAAGVNKLDGFTRELVLLYHVERMDGAELARIFETPVVEIMKRIGAGQIKLGLYLGEVCPGWFE